jgi:hypothetical protein
VAYPLTNILIDALPEDSGRKLLKQVTKVNVPMRTSLYEPGDPPTFAHFLTSGIASVVTTMGDGSTSEVGNQEVLGLPSPQSHEGTKNAHTAARNRTVFCGTHDSADGRMR